MIIKNEKLGIYLELKKDIKLIVQGITGKSGRIFSKMILNSGTQIIAGVVPGKSNETWEGIPVFSSIEEVCQKMGEPEATIIFVPPPFAKDAILEAAISDIPLIVCVTEGVPVQDMCLIKSYLALKEIKSLLIGPNCPGIIVPEKCNISIHPYDWYRKGEMAIISRSGSLSYEVATRILDAGIGISMILGIGGDMVPGMTFAETLELLKETDEIKGIILVGEIGGELEQEAADYIIASQYPKSVMLYIAGVNAPKEKRMGHHGALISGKGETSFAKLEYWKKKNLPTCQNLLEIGKAAKKLLEDS